MASINLEESYPLEGKWGDIRDRMEKASIPTPTGITRDRYLDVAERIVRALADYQDETGAIVDPYHRDEHRLIHAQTRFVGALGRLIAAGRRLDLIEACVKGYEGYLMRLHEVEHAPEFWVKELMYAHGALRDKIPLERLGRWKEVWCTHVPRSQYKAACGGLRYHNLVVFVLTSEFFKIEQGLGGDQELIEEAIRYLSQDFTAYGMYRDPDDPMTYDLVVKQQLDLVRACGYAGEHRAWITEICRRGALTSLLCQSVTGQMPFGGRSNQFHFVEAHFACLCESQARFYKDMGDSIMAGVFKRAGRRAFQITLPWIMDMEPLRQIKQGFHPRLEHGLDSGGYYTVYGALAASLCGTAYHLADEEIEERITPAELGGFVFDLWPGFHKVFATCEGYHVEVDTRADHRKDATGLGRLHRIGVWPETALSGSISSDANYTFGVERAHRNLAFGPAWKDAEGQEHCLADLESEIEDVRLTIRKETPEEVCFEMAYRGDLGGCSTIIEAYSLTSKGLAYSIDLHPEPSASYILVPVIISDGQIEASILEAPCGMDVMYRGAVYGIRLRAGKMGAFTEDPPAPNRNALYRTWKVCDEKVRVFLRREK